jgi:signal peptidase II
MGNPETPAGCSQEQVALAVAVAIAAVDLGTKAAAINLSAVLGSPAVVPVQNGSFTLGIGGSDHNFLLLSLVSASVLGGAGWLYRPLLRQGTIRPVSAGMILGGAVGNLVDRLVHGAVTDFLWLPWVIANLADVAVLIGLLILVPRHRWGQLLAPSAPATTRDPARRARPSAEAFG